METLVVGLGGVIIGSLIANWFTKRREQSQRRHDFIEKHLKKFYSPLLGLRSEIKMLSELRLKISNISGKAWPEGVAEARERGGIDAVGNFSATEGPEFKKQVEYNNQQLTEKLLPAYRKMVEVFRDNLWLADEETKVYYGELVEFIEIWNRSLAKSLPREVLQRIGHSEEKLFPFYEHLQDKHDELRGKLASGEA